MDLSINESMFKKGQTAEYMFIVVSGKIERYEEVNNQLVVADIFSSGQVTGMLPYSRMMHYPGPALAKEASRILRINKKDFAKMLTISEVFDQRLIAEMSDRVRGGARKEQQLEKMASLGQLAAGLAHEVNNPSAAIQRTAAIIKEIYNKQNEYGLKLFRAKINSGNKSIIEDYLHLAKKADKPKFTPLQRSELEEQFSEFLKNKSVKDFEKLSPIFVESGVNYEEIKSLSGRFSSKILNDVLAYIEVNIKINNMLSDLINSAKGISELVSSIKFYSHMDRSLEYKPIDIRQSMDNTLKMLEFKLWQKDILVTKYYQENLQSVQGNAGQLNQVWTHLIDNAIDAVNKCGKIKIEIKNTSMAVEIKVIDNGAGIPDEIIDRIFDAFFTTKDIGQGTGLGLEISQRIIRAHGGQIKSQSKAGKTEMFVLLPLLYN